MSTKARVHDKYAPYWATAMIFFGVIGIAACLIKRGGFWNGYLLDITGPAWNYILFRGLFTSNRTNFWTRFFTPIRTLIIFILVCFSIETMQFFNIYNATYDPWDLLAYCSLMGPLFLIDYSLNS